MSVNPCEPWGEHVHTHTHTYIYIYILVDTPSLPGDILFSRGTMMHVALDHTVIHTKMKYIHNQTMRNIIYIYS